MTYAWLSLAFLGVAALVALVAVLRVRPARASDGRRSPLGRAVASILITAVLLCVLTAVFDNVMIAVGLMQYSAQHITGLHIGAAPLEDFAYPLAGVMLLPALWVLFAGTVRRGR